MAYAGPAQSAQAMLRRVEQEDLTDADIRRALVPKFFRPNDFSVVMYNSLAREASLESLFGGGFVPGRAVALFMDTNAPHDGHWVGLWCGHDGAYHFFDSYGFEPDREWQEARFEPNRAQHLSRLIAASARPTKVNHVRLQAKKATVSTCGRWVELRLAMWQQEDDAFARMVTPAGEGGLDRDLLVTAFTYLL